MGAGVGGLAFTDALVAASDARVVLVDRRDVPGGHWVDGYPFVRLHVPSAYYGVDSTPLGTDEVDLHGPNAGLYGLATGAEVVAYSAQVLEQVLLPTGRVSFLGGHEHEGDGRVRSLRTGERRTVRVRRAVVDAAHLAAELPGRCPRSFAVEPGTRLVGPAELAALDVPAERFVVLGAGKTACDVVVWLLRAGVDPDRVTWVRPRDAWFLDRSAWQPLAQAGRLLDGIAQELELVSAAASVPALLAALEEHGRLLRIDSAVTPTMYRCTTLDAAELALLRSVTDVVRLGRVRALTPGRVRLGDGELATPPGAVHVDCTARGIPDRPASPVFSPGRIALQPIRSCMPSLNAALIGRVEAGVDGLERKNRLTPPNPYPSRPEDWLPGFVRTTALGRLLGEAPDVRDWVDGTRLNPLRGLGQRASEPDLAAALGRFAAAVGPGVAGAQRLLGVSA